MWTEHVEDVVLRCRFLATWLAILAAFWGLILLTEAKNERRRMIWTAPDSAVVAMLANLPWDEEPADCPEPPE